MRGTWKAAAGAAALLLITTSSAVQTAAAQTDGEKLKSLLEELDTLIGKGEAQNLADPWFLQDLRALSNRYGQTWPVVLLDHRFDSKSSLPKAPWEVRKGEMKMDWSRGLRSRVEAKAGQNKKMSDEELVGEIVGGLLGKALGGKDSRNGGKTAADPSTPALAIAELPVSNAFEMKTEITARAMAGDTEGALELGVLQTGNAGYRLIFTPKADRSALVTLYAISQRGTERVIESADYKGTIPDDQPLEITLARRPGGQMFAAIGDEELFSASDRSFNDPFTAVLIANRGGDYAVRRMTLRGTK
ncbi:hypothetical protein AAFN88_17410 [Pelagibius sp. CAU 1746]|uniref:hypothetical protein n=1 Tax=Pelagibius sp. CAU 1746 TaxID=3140370 RepID=UPI00325ADB74